MVPLHSQGGNAREDRANHCHKGPGPFKSFCKKKKKKKEKNQREIKQLSFPGCE